MTDDPLEIVIAPKGSAKAEYPREGDGRFRPGNPGGGCLKGRTNKYNVLKVFRREAQRRGVDIEETIFKVLMAMATAAFEGDAAAAKVFLERTCGPADTPASIALQIAVDARHDDSGVGGPPIPTGEAFATYVAQMSEVAAKQKLLTDDEVGRQREIDDLLS